MKPIQILLVVGIVILLSACKRTSKSNDSVFQQTKNLSNDSKINSILLEAEAISIAKEAAKKEGTHLDDYETPKATFDASTGKWRVYFGLKQPMPGGFFDVEVNDKTKECRIIGGA